MTRPASEFTHAVLVTGASGGIGRAISLAFAAAGWSVGVHYHRNKAAAEDTLTQVVAAGGAGALYEADIRQSHAVQQMVEAFCRQVPVPSVFVCNAGIGGSHLLLRQREDDWAEVLATNLTGTFHCLRAMAPPLLARGGGSIVVIGSHAGFHGSTGQAAYAASKAGLIGLVHTVLAILIGITLGIITALRQYSALDYGVTFMAFMVLAQFGFSPEADVRGAVMPEGWRIASNAGVSERRGPACQRAGRSGTRSSWISWARSARRLSTVSTSLKISSISTLPRARVSRV